MSAMGGGPARPPRPDAAAVRRAGQVDRDEQHYARMRARLAQARARIERESYDPAPPTDDDWTMESEQDDGLQRVRPPASIGEAIEELVTRRGWKEHLRVSATWARWPEIVGHELAEHCEPAGLSGGVLTLRVTSAAWAAQLRYLSPELVDKVDAALGRGTVRRVTIVVGPLRGTTQGTS